MKRAVFVKVFRRGRAKEGVINLVQVKMDYSCNNIGGRGSERLNKLT